MNFTRLISTFFLATTFACIVLFACIFWFYSNADSKTLILLKDSLSTASGFFGGITTLIAAYIASRLFNDWKDSGFSQDRSLSIDRLDDYKPYSFDNIRLVDWETNNKKGSESQITGDNTKNCRAVRQLTMDGIPIQDFHSVKAAARTLGISATGVHEAAQGFRYNKSPAYSAGGYKWEYA